MHNEAHGKGLVAALPSERAMARNLRRWLIKAGVTRPELHEGSSTRRILRWHDLRATGITWMAVRGDAPQLIQSRAGHTDFATTLAYVRAAEALAAGFGDVFPPLPEELVRPRGRFGLWFGQKPNRRRRNSQKQAQSSGVDGTRTRGLRRDRPAL